MAVPIKLFSFIQKYYSVLGTQPQQTNENGPSTNWRNWIFIASLVLFFLTSAAFCVFEANTMLEYGMSFFPTIEALSMMCVYLEMIRQMKNTWQFIQNCERFIEKRENSIIVYRELIKKIERLCEWIGIALTSTVLFVVLSVLIYSLTNYYILDLGKDSFVLAFPVKWPFDWKTPLRYIVVWLVHSAGCAAGAFSGFIILSLMFGSFWLFMVMAEDITKDLAAFNVDVKANPNRAEVMKSFCNIIQLYSDAKELVHEFNAIVKYSLFSTISFLMLSETSLLLGLQFQFMDENAKLVETLVILICAFWIFGLLFAICELSERVTHQFDMFHDEIERCDWQTLPIKMQRMYLIFLADTQQPKNITCFGNILCTRKTFQLITNKAWSYFMTLRKFET